MTEKSIYRLQEQQQDSSAVQLPTVTSCTETSAGLHELSAIGPWLQLPPRCTRKKEGLALAGEQRLRRF